MMDIFQSSLVKPKLLAGGLKPDRQGLIQADIIYSGQSSPEISGGGGETPLNILDYITDYSVSTMKNVERVLQNGYDYFVNGKEIEEYSQATQDDYDSLYLTFNPVNIKKIHILYEAFNLTTQSKSWEWSGWYYHPDGSYNLQISPEFYGSSKKTLEWDVLPENGTNVNLLSMGIQGYIVASGKINIYGIYIEIEDV